jgi:hypothetical protein
MIFILKGTKSREIDYPNPTEKNFFVLFSLFIDPTDDYYKYNQVITMKLVNVFRKLN